VRGDVMAKMTELEAWKLIYAWSRTVPASAHPQFKEARTVLRKFINRVEKANSDPAAAWKLIEQGMAEQGHVLVWSASAEEVRRLVRTKTGCKELPTGFSDKEILKELRIYLRRYGGGMHFRDPLRFVIWSVAYHLATQAGLKWK
jgi:hypothetical protein